jgi:hypothetical protein
VLPLKQLHGSADGRWTATEESWDRDQEVAAFAGLISRCQAAVYQTPAVQEDALRLVCRGPFGEVDNTDESPFSSAAAVLYVPRS